MALGTAPSPLYGLYKARDGFSSFTITLIYAAYAIGAVSTLFLAGHTSDWYGRRRLLHGAIAPAVVSAFVYATPRAALLAFAVAVGVAIVVTTPLLVGRSRVASVTA
jgi:MFS family permease